MLGLYYIVVIAILTITLPLASRKVAYANTDKINDYNPLGYYSKDVRRFIWFAAGAIIVMLIGLCMSKPEDILDNQMYLIMYNMGGAEKVQRSIESSFAIITALAPTFSALIFIYALISVTTHIYSIFKLSPNIWLSLWLYLTFFFVLHDMVQIRAAAALGFLMYSVKYIQERKIVPYVILVLIAFFFHSSAMIMMPLYFLPRKNLNKYVWIGVLVLATVMGLVNVRMGYVAKFIPVNFVQNYLATYMGSKTFAEAGIGPMRIFKVICTIVMLINLDKIKKQYAYCVPVLGLSIISQLCYLLMGDIPVLQGRLGELFGTFEIFALAMFPMISKKHYYLLMIVPIAFAIYNSLSGYFLLTVSSFDLAH